MANTIQVWRWQDAPESYRKLSPHGGDEDWVAYVPEALRHEEIAWMQRGSLFGCCDVSEHDLPGSGLVRIGAHA